MADVVDPSVSVMLDTIRRNELLENNLSDDKRWIEIDGEISGAAFQIQLLLPQDRWSTPREYLTLPPIAIRYESRMESWHLDYMVEAFDAIYGRHAAITGPWVTVVRTGDRRTYHGRDAWDMSRVASLFQSHAPLKPPRGHDSAEDEGHEEVLSVEIHTDTRIGRGGRTKETVLEFHRSGDVFTEVVRFGTGALYLGQSVFLERVVGNILWGGHAEPGEVEGLRAQVSDLIDLLLVEQGGGAPEGTADTAVNADDASDA